MINHKNPSIESIENFELEPTLRAAYTNRNFDRYPPSRDELADLIYYMASQANEKSGCNRVRGGITGLGDAIRTLHEILLYSSTLSYEELEPQLPTQIPNFVTLP